MATKNLQQSNLLSIQTNNKLAMQSPNHLLKSVGQSTLNQRYNNNSSSGIYQSGLPQIYYNKQTQKDLSTKSTNNLRSLRTEGIKSESLDKSSLAKSLCIISQDELNKIKQRIKMEDDLPTYDRQAEKKKLHELSMKRIENWPDNLLNITQKKEKERYEKFEKIEKEKRLIDEQEEAYQREQYRKIIKDSNEKIFAQDPRVRQFKKSMLFSAIMQERKEQMELKKYVDDINNNYNNEQTQQMETIKMHEEEEKQKLKEKKLAQLQQMKQDLAKQLQEMKEKKIQQIMDDQKEGALIKERANEENQENIEKRRKQKQMFQDLQNQLNEEQKKKEVKEKNSQ
ncbi:hypothetical protein TTHERM_000300119 (macronuclear) [Tetrahymena thermophila SB210]|uniref:Trichohyalin-plectin-homology domain-containing protein n=1 Tax=Tetrahymena thermophila (strain SB210) TaxID=312017 RepID=W7XDG5_TETTS|nr:hypothetical protein TTHERM_000300119 [Tetrahymena thermophila SB210]EWS71861.1 hypothetical protein TTHERM_000300119 [Tetrahymena thermophila SB210]|eukprot:XP_012655605.1 hypothetical protein TTHERM_000300119 [Tetrahymena thermophila SB210]